MNKGIIFFIILLIGAGFAVITFKNTQKTIPNEAPKYRDISKTNFFLGKFKPYEMVLVQPEISGIIDSIYIKSGDKVSVGDKIAKLRIVPIPEELERTKKALRIANTDLKQKIINHNRNTNLFNKGVISRMEFENTALELNFAKIENSNAQNNYNISQKGFSKNVNASPNIVKATINGEVLNVLVKKGVNVTKRNTYNDGNTIATIVNTSSFMYEFEITESDISHIKIGDTFSVSIKALNNKLVNARVNELIPLIKKDESFYYLVSAIVLDTISTLKPGFTGLAEFTLQHKEDVLSVKEKNIIFRNRKSFIELIGENDVIETVEVKVGISDGVYTEVLSKLKKSDKIKIQ
ncbi:efflux RND transporter periplasmic adaptor subunit [Polaribacter sp. 11A2H]|uniref:efflux RND transporter periplasmic adaptor subunit n=1 Tax=Polaribacter sp. 11A2H TaxID=2687290 RepID=UPI00140970C5|nr:efflux RND transporter periplasmic adaptor subunit [Polaribacter sp. 11A2H]